MLPACARCARLKIECVGCGQQRFKFKELKINKSKARLNVEPQSDIITIAQTINNQTTITASAFISSLGVNDLRYDLGCYGEWLKGIPCRLGTNSALDAASIAFTSAFPSVCAQQVSPTPETLSSYIHALKTLRISLSDSTKRFTIETLCAIYLIMICQVPPLPPRIATVK